MAVIAVLVAVAIPTFGSQLEKARQATDRANLRDAYASAKLAIQTSDETTGTIKSALNAGGVDGSTVAYATGTYCFWYKADGDNDGWTYAGTTDTAVVATPTVANALFMKATTAVNLDANALPTSITYVAKPSTVATDAGILILIAYNKTANAFTLSGIGFSTDGVSLVGGLEATGASVSVSDNTATTIPNITVKFSGQTITTGYTLSADATNRTALESLGLTITTAGALAQTTNPVTTAPADDVDVTLTVTHTESGKSTTVILTYTAPTTP